MAKCPHCGLKRNDVADHEIVCGLTKERDAALLKLSSALDDNATNVRAYMDQFERANALQDRLDVALAAKVSNEEHIGELRSRMLHDEKSHVERLKECQAGNRELRSRLDALSAAVRGAWNANREGDMFQSLGRAMDIVDPERNEQPIRAVERHEHKYGGDGLCSCGIHALD